MSTDTTPPISLIGRTVNKLIDHGQITVAIVILLVISFIFYNWIQENNRQERERMERYEAKYDALEKYVRNQFTPAIEKNNRILEEVSRKLDKND